MINRKIDSINKFYSITARILRSCITIASWKCSWKLFRVEHFIQPFLLRRVWGLIRLYQTFCILQFLVKFFLFSSTGLNSLEWPKWNYRFHYLGGLVVSLLLWRWTNVALFPKCWIRLWRNPPKEGCFIYHSDSPIQELHSHSHPSQSVLAFPHVRNDWGWVNAVDNGSCKRRCKSLDMWMFRATCCYCRSITISSSLEGT